MISIFHESPLIVVATYYSLTLLIGDQTAYPVVEIATTYIAISSS